MKKAEMLAVIDAAASKITEVCAGADTVLIAGSGLGGFAERLSDCKSVPYSEIPGFPCSTVPGHAGMWVTGTIGGKRIAVMNGRVHGYEGNGAYELAFPVRVMARMGVKTLIVTNAAGGVNLAFKPGDLMILTDYINFSGMNPLTGANIDEIGPRFPDMSNALTRELIAKAKQAAAEEGLDVREGVYAMMNGPSFESPAEIRMMRILGADAVGMSTVPEIITACHAGIKVLGISCITNMAAGILAESLNHLDVLEIGNRVADRFASWVARIVANIE
ncbi:MAG: purine-nucleoside phosphorylase [Oscillospiraceae bacterium]|jgi:purine-nucleoside phosphorylase|nr:purine-nucleoside phosphorylase [Oscillospiraceae bacterium]